MMNIYKIIILWFTGGLVYFYMEIAFRGYSHYSMLICGGICFVTVGYAGRSVLARIRKAAAVPVIMLTGAAIITCVEFVTGIYVNIILGLNVWSYADIKYNLMGQICPLYSMLWSLLSLLCVYMDIIIRKYIFDEIPVKADRT